MVLNSKLLLLISMVSCSVNVSTKTEAEPPVLSEQDAYVSLLSTANHQHMTRQFAVTEASDFRVLYQGEGADSDMAPSLVETYHNDCVEFYIDTKGTDRQFRFVWGSREISGKSFIREGISFAQSDPSGNEYCFEICFPWKILGMEYPGDKGGIITDCSVIDNDAESRKTQIAWHSPDSYIWRGSQNHGTMRLQGLKAWKKPVIDGIEDSIWEESPKLEIGNEIIGKVRDSLDLSAYFRVLHDSDALYVFIHVTDDIKKKASVIFDTAQITDVDGNVLWKAKLERTVHAGGALKNRRQEDTLSLEAGKYTLSYSTDESHSAGHWDALPPDEEFSGVILYELD